MKWKYENIKNDDDCDEMTNDEMKMREYQKWKRKVNVDAKMKKQKRRRWRNSELQNEIAKMLNKKTNRRIAQKSYMKKN